ncbi:MAG TPA: ATP-binding protein [Thermoleophilaceae bacterium]|nr:ATP-binding protein [Thermoleophilaceae bacterium]
MRTIELRGGPEAVGAARHAIERLADEEQLPRVEDLRLLVSELVTNSVLHGGAGPDDHVHMHVKLPDNCVRVEVCDEGNGWSDQLRSRSLESAAPAGGWGLVLVGALADRWGVEVGEETCVWFEISPAT